MLSPAPREATTGAQTTHENDYTSLVRALSEGKDFVAQGCVNNVLAEFLVDTEAAVTLIASQLWEKAKKEGAQLRPATGHRLVNVKGDFL